MRSLCILFLALMIGCNSSRVIDASPEQVREAIPAKFWEAAWKVPGQENLSGNNIRSIPSRTEDHVPTWDVIIYVRVDPDKPNQITLGDRPKIDGGRSTMIKFEAKGERQTIVRVHCWQHYNKLQAPFKLEHRDQKREREILDTIERDAEAIAATQPANS